MHSVMLRSVTIIHLKAYSEENGRNAFVYLQNYTLFLSKGQQFCLKPQVRTVEYFHLTRKKALKYEYLYYE